MKLEIAAEIKDDGEIEGIDVKGGSNAFYEKIKPEMMIIIMDKPDDKTVPGS